MIGERFRGWVVVREGPVVDRVTKKRVATFQEVEREASIPGTEGRGAQSALAGDEGLRAGRGVSAAPTWGGVND